MNTKYIFVTGGVVSGLGKGITAASLGRLLKNRGYKIRYKKTFKDYVKNLIAICISVLFFIIILNLPFVKSFFNELAKNNYVIKTLLSSFN